MKNLFAAGEPARLTRTVARVRNLERRYIDSSAPTGNAFAKLEVENYAPQAFPVEWDFFETSDTTVFGTTHTGGSYPTETNTQADNIVLLKKPGIYLAVVTSRWDLGAYNKSLVLGTDSSVAAGSFPSFITGLKTVLGVTRLNSLPSTITTGEDTANLGQDWLTDVFMAWQSPLASAHGTVGARPGGAPWGTNKIAAAHLAITYIPTDASVLLATTVFP